MSHYNNWLIEQDMGIFWLKLNRLDKMNSFSAEVATELDEILQGFVTNPEIRVLILSSNSDHFFSAGADVPYINLPAGLGRNYDLSIKQHFAFADIAFYRPSSFVCVIHSPLLFFIRRRSILSSTFG